MPEDTHQQKFEVITLFPHNSNMHKKYQQLTSLHNNFLHIAETFGKIIISEHFIADEYKTIPPTNMPGQAGGFDTTFGYSINKLRAKIYVSRNFV